jgi:Terminase large subunit, T4likevirus-type, N-terminal
LDALLLLQVPWEPFPESPQQMALESKANVIGFGGAAGGGKTDLLLGAAHTQHHRSIIFRRELAQLEGLEDRGYQLFSGKGKFNSTKHVWQLGDGRRIEFGGVEREKDVTKYMGRAHDLKAFDELPHFTEFQFRYLKGWNRTSRAGQRCRVMAAFNPPTSAEGDWVIRYFAPWLDKRHPRPAADGELRWYAMLDGKEREVRNGGKITWPPNGSERVREGEKQEVIQPESRTFFRSRVENNPVYMASGYKATLQILPEPYRSLMLEGRFDISQLDHPNQVIPTEWVEAAMARWRKRPREQLIPALTDVGVDVARGGLDKTVYALRANEYVDDLILHPGKTTPDGQSIIRDLIGLLGAKAPLTVKVKIDAVGVGSSPVDLGKMFGLKVVPMFGGGKSGAHDKSKKLGFFNKRAEWIWKLREALDPASGQDIELPPSRSLLADLTAPRHELVARGIKIEAKDEIKERIGRSPDEGEAVIYAFGQGSNAVIGGPLVFIGGRPDSTSAAAHNPMRP